MRSFPKELFSRIPAKALNHSGLCSLLSGNTTLHIGFTGADETIKSFIDRALDGELIVTNPVTKANTIIDRELITHIGFVVSKPFGKQKMPNEKNNFDRLSRLASIKVVKTSYQRESDLGSQNN